MIMFSSVYMAVASGEHPSAWMINAPLKSSRDDCFLIFMEDQRYKNCTNGEDMLTFCNTPDHGISSANIPGQQGLGLGFK